ncbi:SRPBCC family protein [Arthrobacter globiformis]|uniref:SRPBCC family protein n=1 Tax=Arthrobacter globiformis TaxID=1665 RepID=UPI00278285C8|nr:SRPBCC domain-containing protein [Arthrobacter globiformis]MDQ0866988.1 hypothetical protein [Arthrobacter globiformis]
MTDNTIRLTRYFPHPPEAVWKALTTPDLLARWWAPGGIAPPPLSIASPSTWALGAPSSAKSSA